MKGHNATNCLGIAPLDIEERSVGMVSFAGKKLVDPDFVLSLAIDKVELILSNFYR